MAERLPPGVYEADSVRLASLPNGLEQNGIHYPEGKGERHLVSPTDLDSNGTDGATELARDSAQSIETSSSRSQGIVTSSGRDDHPDLKHPNGNGGVQMGTNGVLNSPDKESGPLQGGENGMKPKNSALPGSTNQVEAEWIEQYELGVYITLVALRDGTRDLKRVRFR